MALSEETQSVQAKRIVGIFKEKQGLNKVNEREKSG